MQTIHKSGWLGGVLAVLTLLASPLASAQSDEMETTITKVGEEVFAAGESFSIGGNKGLAWALGNVIDVTEPTGGVIAAGRAISINEGANGPVIVAGSSIDVTGPVAGSIYAAGESISLDVAHTVGTLLIIGSNVEFKGATAGTAYLAGDKVRVEGNVAGDLYVTAESFSIADDAIVGGEIVYDVGDREGFKLPDGIDGREVTESEFRDEVGGQLGVNTGSGVAGDIGFFFFSLIIGILVIVLMRRQSDHFADWLATRPLQTIGTGFVGLSFWIGLTLTSIAVVLALASGLSWFFLILLVLVPVVMLAGFVLMVVAYYHGVYAVGSLAGRFIPEGLSPIAVRIAILAVSLFVLFLVGLVLPGLAMLLGSACLVIGFGALGLRVWSGLPQAA